MVDARGRVSTVIYNLGPGRLGTLLESIAVPEIRTQATELAYEITMSFQEKRERESAGPDTLAAGTHRAEARVEAL